MAVAFDAVGPSSSGAASASSPDTWTHTPAGTPSAVLAGAAVGYTTAGTDSNGGCTYGGTAMTWLARVYVLNASFGGYIEIFGLASPPSGAQTVSYTPATTSALASLVGGSLSYTGTAATTAAAFGTPVVSTPATFGSSGSISVTGTSASNRVAAIFASGGGTQAITAGTLRWLDNYSSATSAGAAMGADIVSAAGSVTLSGTWSFNYWGAIAVEVLAGSAPPAAAGRGLSVTRVPVARGAYY